jgi:hypothetical protein
MARGFAGVSGARGEGIRAGQGALFNEINLKGVVRQFGMINSLWESQHKISRFLGAICRQSRLITEDPTKKREAGFQRSLSGR